MDSFFSNRQVISRLGKKNRDAAELPQIRFFQGRIGPEKKEPEEPEEVVDEVHSCDDGMKVEAVMVDNRIDRIVVQCGCGKQTVIRCKYPGDTDAQD